MVLNLTKNLLERFFAISNRELQVTLLKRKESSGTTIWILEDLGNMNNMIRPVKTLNLDDLKDKFNEEINLMR